jgi:hypothetical protein
MSALSGKRTSFSAIITSALCQTRLSRLLDRKKKSGLATVNRERRQSRRLPVSLTPPAKEAAIC